MRTRMAKRSKKSEEITEVTVRYELLELPTAQHKAGLAGLLLQIESMKKRRERGAPLSPPPEIVDKGPTFAEVCFTAESTQALFDELYDAEVKEQYRRKKGTSGFRREEFFAVKENDRSNAKQEKRYVHDVIVPRGNFLRTYTDDGKEAWHKLWQDMLFTIPRNQDATLGPFKDMAKLRLASLGPKEWFRMDVAQRKADKKSYLHCREGLTVWDDLVIFEGNRRRERISLVEVSGAILLGAQAINAESVKFEDRADHALLLHFWQLTARIFVPAQIVLDEKTKKWKQEFVGYVIAVPEVSDVIEFTHAFKRSLSELRGEKRGYRPADSVISLPAEGALAFMHQLDRLAAARTLTRRAPMYLSGIEFFHMLKIGNNIKTASHGRVPAWDHLLTKYDGLMSRDGPKNPIMLAGRLKALLNNQPWFAALTDDLVEREWSWFVHSTQDKHVTPPAMRGFAYEAFKQFERLSHQETTMPEVQDPKTVDRVVYRLVKQYVREKASARMGVSTADQDAWYKATHDSASKRERPAYQDERRHVAQGLFLALRSRHDEDFVEHFTATLGSVAQYLPENDYAILAAALMRTFADGHGESRLRTREDVKTLTLLALSAQSRSLTASSDQPEPTDPVAANKE